LARALLARLVLGTRAAEAPNRFKKGHSWAREWPFGFSTPGPFRVNGRWMMGSASVQSAPA